MTDPATFLLGAHEASRREDTPRQRFVGYAFLSAGYEDISHLLERMEALDRLHEWPAGSRPSWVPVPQRWHRQEAVGYEEDERPAPALDAPSSETPFEEVLLVTPEFAGRIENHPVTSIRVFASPRFLSWSADLGGGRVFTRRIHRNDWVGARLACAPAGRVDEHLRDTLAIDPDWTLDILENGVRRVPRPAGLAARPSADILAPFFDSTDRSDARKAARLLGRVAPPSPELRARFLSHPDRDVREAVIRRLGESRPPAAR